MLDEMLPGVVEPMCVVDDHQLRCATPHLFVGVANRLAELVGDVSLFGHDHGPVGRARLDRLRHEPIDQRGLADARRTVETTTTG